MPKMGFGQASLAKFQVDLQGIVCSYECPLVQGVSYGTLVLSFFFLHFR
jgi:hypothetical protein